MSDIVRAGRARKTTCSDGIRPYIYQYNLESWYGVWSLVLLETAGRAQAVWGSHGRRGAGGCQVCPGLSPPGQGSSRCESDCGCYCNWPLCLSRAPGAPHHFPSTVFGSFRLISMFKKGIRISLLSSILNTSSRFFFWTFFPESPGRLWVSALDSSMRLVHKRNNISSDFKSSTLTALPPVITLASDRNYGSRSPSYVRHAMACPKATWRKATGPQPG